MKSDQISKLFKEMTGQSTDEVWRAGQYHPANFSMVGSPHKPLVHIQHNHSEHLQGDVASTGNSPMLRVCEGLSLNGGIRYQSPKAEHWRSLEDKYHDERDLLYWIKTGKHLPQPGERGPREQTTRRKAAKLTAELLSDIEV